jgi:hypothetical protein
MRRGTCTHIHAHARARTRGRTGWRPPGTSARRCGCRACRWLPSPPRCVPVRVCVYEYVRACACMRVCACLLAYVCVLCVCWGLRVIVCGLTELFFLVGSASVRARACYLLIYLLNANSSPHSISRMRTCALSLSGISFTKEKVSRRRAVPLKAQFGCLALKRRN